MRIEQPRLPVKVKVGDRMVYKVGKNQMEALKGMAKLGKSEPPPKGWITATGRIRNHLFNDMIISGFINIDRRRPGLADFVLTKDGHDVIEHGIVAGDEKVETSLKRRQRARNQERHDGERAKRATARNGRRVA